MVTTLNSMCGGKMLTKEKAFEYLLEYDKKRSGNPKIYYRSYSSEPKSNWMIAKFIWAILRDYDSKGRKGSAIQVAISVDLDEKHKDYPILIWNESYYLDELVIEI